MKKYFWIIFGLGVLVIIIGGFLLWQYYKNRQNIVTTSVTNQSSSSQPTTESTSSQSTVPTLTIVYPIDNYIARLTKNSFGSYYSGQNRQKLDSDVCSGATEYTGYHTGDDLETTPAEQNNSVEIFSIAAGTIRQIGSVSGYGGLAVTEYNLGGGIYTAYFGHIDLATTKLKPGDTVSIGEKIAELAPACSAANDNIRKHLHFALHKGNGIDVKGYVASKSTLSTWADPKILLNSLGAK